MTNKMKQTAVEWLIDMLVTENEITLKGENYKLFEIAKAIEKEQIKNSFVECWKANVLQKNFLSALS